MVERPTLEILFDRQSGALRVIAQLQAGKGDADGEPGPGDGAHTVSLESQAEHERTGSAAPDTGPDDGQVIEQRAYLGVTVQEIPDVLLAQFPDLLGPEQGLLVTEVAPHSPAYQSGLRANMVLLGLNDQRLSSVKDIEDLVSTQEPGDTVTLDVLSAGKVMTFRVTLIERVLIM